MSNKLWGWGINMFWELGVGDCEPRPRPTPVPAPNLALVSVDDQRAFGLGVDGTLWSWGDEVGGRLGLSETDGYAGHPMVNAYFSRHRVTGFASGKDYSYASVDENGSSTWWWWGRGRNNWEASLGLASDQALIAPSESFRMTRIAAFWDESIGTSPDGNVFTWRPNDGANSFAQVLGFPRPVVDVVTHGGDAAALDDQGHVYFWKLENRWAEATNRVTQELTPFFATQASYQRLGRQPRRVFSQVHGRFMAITITSTGVLFGVHESGEVWAVGPNTWAEIPGADRGDWVEDWCLQGLPEITMVTGCKGRGFALDRDRRVWTWGHEIGTPPAFGGSWNTPVPAVVPELANAVHISAHSGNFLALLED